MEDLEYVLVVSDFPVPASSFAIAKGEQKSLQRWKPHTLLCGCCRRSVGSNSQRRRQSMRRHTLSTLSRWWWQVQMAARSAWLLETARGPKMKGKLRNVIIQCISCCWYVSRCQDKRVVQQHSLRSHQNKIEAVRGTWVGVLNWVRLNDFEGTLVDGPVNLCLRLFMVSGIKGRMS